MAIDFQQTDTGVTGINGALCGGVSQGSGALIRLAEQGGVAGSIEFTKSYSASTAAVIAYFKIEPSAGSSWAAGDWTCRLNITTSNMNLQLDAVRICRAHIRESDGILISDAQIGVTSGLAQSLGTAGVIQVVVAGSAQTPNAGDFVVVKFEGSNTNTMSTQACGITPSEIISSPFTAAAGAGATLTGQSAAFAAGSMDKEAAKAASGSQATFTAGSVDNKTARAIIGQSATATAGNAKAATSKALAGEASSSAAGSVTASGPIIEALSGASATFSQGTAKPVRAALLSGESISSAAGTVSAGSSAQAALTGAQASFSAGSVDVARSKALSGSVAASSAGTVDVAHAKALSGQVVTSASGSVDKATSKQLAGAQAAATAGTVSAGSTAGATLSGSQAVASVGTLRSRTTRAVSGAAFVATAGLAAPTHAQALAGSTTTPAAGSFEPDVTRALAGSDAAFGQGLVGTVGNVTVGLMGQAMSAEAGSVAPVTAGQPSAGGGTHRQRVRWRRSAEHVIVAQSVTQFVGRPEFLTFSTDGNGEIRGHALKTPRSVLARLEAEAVWRVDTPKPLRALPPAAGPKARTTAQVTMPSTELRTRAGKPTTAYAGLFARKKLTGGIQEASVTIRTRGTRAAAGAVHPVGVQNPSERELARLALELVRQRRSRRVRRNV